MELREIALAVIFTALYAGLVVILAPISFGPLQLRLADALIPLSALFGKPVIIGTTLGCFVANYYYYLGPLDVTLGPLANLVASAIIFLFRKRSFLACLIASILIGFIVGSYLWFFLPPPSILASLGPPWLAMIISITVSSLMTVSLIGYTLLKFLSKSNIIRIFERVGIKVYLGEGEE